VEVLAMRGCLSMGRAIARSSDQAPFGLVGSHNPASDQARVIESRVRLVTVGDLDFEHVGFGDAAVEYLTAWNLQREVHATVVAGGTDTVLLLEPPPVFTAGKRTEPHERPSSDVDDTPVIDVDRGGKITFHGPGQLVGYPIVRLPAHVLVVDFVRRLEEALIHTCTDLDVTTARIPGRSGVWMRGDDKGPERKLAAIGIRVSRGVTMHGFALNCDVDLSWYDRFVPCGIADAGVTSLSRELGRDVTVEEVVPVVEKHLRGLLGWEPYDPTPSYAPRPEPGRRRPGTLSVPVLKPVVQDRSPIGAPTGLGVE